MNNGTLTFDTIVIGGGQAGLATGYYLKQAGRDFVILDAGERIGDSWRKRWDSLRLFTPARFDSLPGMRFPAPPDTFPTKDQMADYLEIYAGRFRLPVRTGVKVDCLTKRGDRFIVVAGDRQYDAKHVVVAMGSWQKPYVPPFAQELDEGIAQMHSSQYRSPQQLRDGGVLVVGAGNSGAEIALESAQTHRTWLSGRDTGHIPFRLERTVVKHLVLPVLFRVIFHRILTTSTPIGRKRRPKLLGHAMPLIRVKPKDLTAAGVERVQRTIGVRDGLPMVEDGRALDVANVIWSTGYHPDFSWIDLPVVAKGEPEHERGVVTKEPGLYFVGLYFLYAASSGQIHGVERDAAYVVQAIESRKR